MESVIQLKPPQDAREWDCQCARCGSSFFYDPDDEYGEGWHGCMSSQAWCESNPRPGRENVSRGEIEWYTFDEPNPQRQDNP